MTILIGKKKTIGGMLLALVFILIALLSNLKGLSPAPASENLGCSTLSNCSSNASCNEKGMTTGYLINCKSGATITCPSTF